MFVSGAFLSYAFVMSFTPGPNNFLALSTASRGGLKSGLRFCLGVFCGVAIVMSLCAASGALLMNLLPKVEPLMKALGAAFLTWLAWSAFRDKGGGGMSPGAGSFLTGVMMQFVNAKLAIYAVTSITTFVLPRDDSFSALVLAVFLLSFIGFAGVCCWTLFGSAFRRVHAARPRAVGAVMALLLLYCAFMMLTS